MSFWVATLGCPLTMWPFQPCFHPAKKRRGNRRKEASNRNNCSQGERNNNSNRGGKNIQGVAKKIRSYQFPDEVLDELATVRRPVYEKEEPSLALDAWVANKKCYIVDLRNQTLVSIRYPRKPPFQPFLKVGSEVIRFDRAGAVMGFDDMIVVKDAIGLHFFSADTDEFQYSSGKIQMPYGLARLQDGSFVTMSEADKKLFVVSTKGKIVKEMELPKDVIFDLEGGKFGYRARIRFMCSGVRKDGVEAIYMVDTHCARIYSLNAETAELIWKITLPQDELEPRGIVALPSGKIIVVRYNKNDLLVLDENGEIERRLECSPPLRKPQGMYLREQDGFSSLLIAFAVPVTTEAAVHEYKLPTSVLA